MGFTAPLPPVDDSYMQAQLRRVGAPPPPPPPGALSATPASTPATPDRAAIAAKYGGVPDKASIAAKYGGTPVAASTPTSASTSPADAPPAPGFLTRLAQSVGVPTSLDEAGAMAPSTAEMLLGPAATGAKAVYGLGKNIVDASLAGSRELAESADNISRGQPVLPNLGKAAFAATKAGLEGPLSVVGGKGVQKFGEDIADKNYLGAAGGAVGAVINGLLLKSALTKPEPAAVHIRQINKLSAAVDASGSKVDFPAALSRVSADTEQAMRAKGVDPAQATVKDFVDGVQDANRALETEYGLAMQPVAHVQTVPQSIYNELMSKAASMNPKLQVERRTAAMLRQRAAEFAQPFSIAELDGVRKNANARLQAFESASGPKQAASLRQSVDTLADKVIADGARDIIYDTMEQHHGTPGMFRDLKQRQSAMLELQPELQGRLTELSNATAKQRGQPLFTGETLHAYGTQHGRVGASVHGLQKLIPLERFQPTGAANLAVRQAFTEPTPWMHPAVQAMPLRFLLTPPAQGQSQTAPPPPAP